MLGPNYATPPPPLSEQWRGADGISVTAEPADYRTWWSIFADPALDSLIAQAYANNTDLASAGARVLEARARRGLARADLFPQDHSARGGLAFTDPSAQTATARASAAAGGSGPSGALREWSLGYDASWEIDLWGKYRRAIEAADAEMLASIATYDDVLVSLLGEVASEYVRYRTLQKRMAVARRNLDIQQQSFEIADVRFRGGAVTELDAAQAASLLENTRALLPNLEAQLRISEHALSVLLGVAPTALPELHEGRAEIPVVPDVVRVGVPAELLRRRPDVRAAERRLAAQSARIGIAKTEYMPSLSLTGSIGVAAEDGVDLFKGSALEAFGGPQFRWRILDFGRIAHEVRIQDARFQSLLSDYEGQVLQAQREVENAIASYRGAREQAIALEHSIAAAQRAVDLALIQYREGAADYTRVLDTQQFLVEAHDRYVQIRGTEAASLVSLYRALGGGWEIREGSDFVSERAKAQMRARTAWGSMLDDHD